MGIQTLDISPLGRVEGDLDERVDIEDSVLRTKKELKIEIIKQTEEKNRRRNEAHAEKRTDDMNMRNEYIL